MKETKKLPNNYWTFEFSEDSSKARLLIGAPQCFIKLLSKAVTAVLKLMYRQIEKYNSTSYYFLGVKLFLTKQYNQTNMFLVKSPNVR